MPVNARGNFRGNRRPHQDRHWFNNSRSYQPHHYNNPNPSQAQNVASTNEHQEQPTYQQPTHQQQRECFDGQYQQTSTQIWSNQLAPNMPQQPRALDNLVKEGMAPRKDELAAQKFEDLVSQITSSPNQPQQQQMQNQPKYQSQQQQQQQQSFVPQYHYSSPPPALQPFPPAPQPFPSYYYYPQQHTTDSNSTMGGNSTMDDNSTMRGNSTVGGNDSMVDAGNYQSSYQQQPAPYYVPFQSHVPMYYAPTPMPQQPHFMPQYHYNSAPPTPQPFTTYYYYPQQQQQTTDGNSTVGDNSTMDGNTTMDAGNYHQSYQQQPASYYMPFQSHVPIYYAQSPMPQTPQIAQVAPMFPSPGQLQSSISAPMMHHPPVVAVAPTMSASIGVGSQTEEHGSNK